MEGRTERSRAAAADSERRAERLQAETRMKEMLQASIYEMKNTVIDLERKLHSVEDEGNEWKTRFETQIELNKQLETQIRVLQEKSEYLRGNPTDRLSSIRSYDQMQVGALNQYLKRLEEEIILMENQLKDFELRIEQEAKTSAAQEAARKQPSDPAHVTREKQAHKSVINSSTKQKMGSKKKDAAHKAIKQSHAPKMKHKPG
ncbi:coiled-coil domain-containing protein 169-like isoform 2-T2 [Anomaloglossus baeobatrachus]|uniref:coiled-coil domain-containing protein 169 isoform X2 n=1 Tax=Anomaloglossus baeobatrachus TaxID=238106 RepID=UPI003F5037C3